LYNLSPSQRRIVHMALADEEGIETTSEGEGAGRYLVVKPLK
jgi:spoIIIJ-associated protein